MGLQAIPVSILSTLPETDVLALIQAAWEARANAHVPFSGFRVGAALLCADGRVFLGCNVEASNYSLTVCAERVALLKAVSEGVRQFRAIAIATAAATFP